jgi:hypothetical protein
MRRKKWHILQGISHGPRKEGAFPQCADSQKVGTTTENQRCPGLHNKSANQARETRGEILLSLE